jgi:voltage-gated potassium channel
MRAAMDDPRRVFVSHSHLQRERWRLLHNVIRTLEPAMTGLGVIWLALLVVDFTRGLTPVLAAANHIIWAVFAADFLVELAVAPRKIAYLRRHWIVALSLAVPVVRVARFARLMRAGRIVRGAKLVRTLGSFNRGMSALRATMRRRGLAYVVSLTLVATVAGAAAMYAFENGVRDPSGIHDYGTALWWTAMIMTTMGSAYWPQTAEGRILCVLLALYSFTVFGYMTASLATFFIDRDAERQGAGVAGQRSIEAVREDIAALRALVQDRLGDSR